VKLSPRDYTIMGCSLSASAAMDGYVMAQATQRPGIKDRCESERL
jgi:hypothetical protein